MLYTRLETKANRSGREEGERWWAKGILPRRRNSGAFSTVWIIDSSCSNEMWSEGGSCWLDIALGEVGPVEVKMV